MNVDSTTSLGHDVEIVGTIAFVGQLTFDGQLRDGAITGRDLIVGPKAVVRGNISVRSLVLHGTVSGEVRVAGPCELGPVANLTGSLFANRLTMRDGATLLGSVAITRDGKAPSPSA